MLNGRFGAAISVDDRGLRYGDGVFESIRLSRGELPLLSLHLSRLARSLARLDIDIDIRVLEKNLEVYLGELKRLDVDSGILKILVSRGVGGQGYIPPLPNPSIATTLFSVVPQILAKSPPQSLVLLHSRLSQNPVLAGLKHLCKLEYVLAARELLQLKSDDCSEGLLLDTEGKVVESLHHNIFVSSNGQLLTPQLKLAGVDGVMRRLLIDEFAPMLNIDLQECDLYPDDLLHAEEVFICNSVRGFTPIKQFQNKTWQRWPMVDRLAQCLEVRWGA